MERVYDHNEKNDKIRRRRDRRTLMLKMEDEGRIRTNAASGNTLTIGNPNDAHEQQADAVAQKVMSGGNAGALLSNTPTTAELNRKAETGTLMAKGDDGGLQATDQLQSALSNSKGGGQSLEPNLQQEMGSKMNADLSQVKIHTNTTAHEMSEGINAKAFTHGQDIYFKDGNYNPSSNEGKELLAHELAHTVQQQEGIERKIQRQVDNAFFVSDLFRRNIGLADVANGKTTLKQGDKDGEMEFLDLPENNNGSWKSDIYTPIRMIKKALARLGYLKVYEPEYDTEGVFDADMAIAVLQFKRTYDPAASDGNEIDAELLSRLDTEEFLKEIELLDELGGKEQLKIVSPPSFTQSPPGNQTTLATAPGESKIRIYKELFNLDPQKMEAPDNIIREVDNGVTAFYSGTSPDPWYYMNVEQGIETITGYVNGRNINFSVNIPVLPSVAIQPDLFEYNDLKKDRISSKTTFTVGNDAFEARVYRGDLQGLVFYIRIVYTGEGFAESAYADIPVYNSDLGLDDTITFPYDKTTTIEFYNNAEGGRLIFNFINLKSNDSPMPIPNNDWAQRTLYFSHSYDYDYNWEPAARRHIFSRGEFLPDGNPDEQVTALTIVPEFAERKNNTKKKSAGSSYPEKKLSRSASLGIAYDGLTILTTPLKDAQKSKWPAGDTLLNKNDRSLAYVIATVKKDNEKATGRTMSREDAETLANIVTGTKDDLQNLYGIYIFMSDGIKAQLANNLSLTIDQYTNAVDAAYGSPQLAMGIFKQAQLMNDFVLNKIQTLAIQKGGINDSRLAPAADTFKNMRMSIADRSGDNRLLDPVIQSELLKLSGSIERDRQELFGSSIAARTQMPAPQLTTDQVIGLIDLVAVDYLLTNAYYEMKKSGLNRDDLDEKYIDFVDLSVITTDFIIQINDILNAPDFSRGEEINEKLDSFYAILNSDETADFNAYIKGLYENIRSQKEEYDFYSNLFIMVVSYVAAEVLTAGLATVFAPLLAGETVAETVAITNAFTRISSITAFTGFNAALGSKEVTLGSFTQDLVTNFIMFGFLNKVGGAFAKNILPEIESPVVGFFAQQAVAIGALQTFAEFHTLVTTGNVMTPEERMHNLVSNIGLHFTMQVTGAIMQGFTDRVYNRTLSPLISKNQLALQGITGDMEASLLKIADNSKLIQTSGSITTDQVMEIRRYYELEKRYYDTLKELSPEHAGDVEAAKKVLMDKYDALNFELNYKLTSLGVTVPEAVKQSTSLILVAKDRLQFDKRDYRMLKNMFENNGGKFEYIKENLYKGIQNGRELYFEQVKGLREPTVEEKTSSDRKNSGNEERRAKNELAEKTSLKNSKLAMANESGGYGTKKGQPYSEDTLLNETVMFDINSFDTVNDTMKKLITDTRNDASDIAQRIIEKAEKDNTGSAPVHVVYKGITTKDSGSAELVMRDVVDAKGEYLRTEIELVFIKDMEYRTALHEIGHLKQMEKLVESGTNIRSLSHEFVWEKVNASGRTVVKSLDSFSGKKHSEVKENEFTMADDAVTEYHNRLTDIVEMRTKLNTAGKAGDPVAMRELMDGVNDYRENYKKNATPEARKKLKVLDDEIPDLEKKYEALKKEMSLQKDPQTGLANAKSISEATSIIQAESQGMVINPRRPDLLKQEPNLDFIIDGPPPYKYADVKTPVSTKYRPVEKQADDVMQGINAQKANDVLHIVDLKNFSPQEKAQFMLIFNEKIGSNKNYGLLNNI